jgi:hypothetical protein
MSNGIPRPLRYKKIGRIYSGKCHAVAGGAVAAAAIAFLSTGCIGVASSQPSTARASISIVLEEDVTKSIRPKIRAAAQRAVAHAVPRLIRFAAGAPVNMSFRKISHYSGTPLAAVATYSIAGVRTCSNPFDSNCRQAREDDLVQARTQARHIADDIASRHFPAEGTGTVIRPALAAGIDLLRGSTGQMWIVAVTDLLPSNAAPPQPTIDLSGIHVVVVYLCGDAIAICQQRRTEWTKRFELDYHALSVTFLSVEQVSRLFADTETTS